METVRRDVEEEGYERKDLVRAMYGWKVIPVKVNMAVVMDLRRRKQEAQSRLRFLNEKMVASKFETRAARSKIWENNYDMIILQHEWIDLTVKLAMLEYKKLQCLKIGEDIEN